MGCDIVEQTDSTVAQAMFHRVQFHKLLHVPLYAPLQVISRMHNDNNKFWNSATQRDFSKETLYNYSYKVLTKSMETSDAWRYS